MKKLFLLICICSATVLVHAQQHYAVKIADAKTEEPLAKATVIIKSNGTKFITNETGLLVITAGPGDVLLVNCAGYTAQEATLSKSSAVHVFLNKKKPKAKNRH